MNHQEVVNGLLQLGHVSGWVITGDEITFWQNSEPQPTTAQLKTASAAFKQNVENAIIDAATAKTALLKRLGITADEAALLLS